MLTCGIFDYRIVEIKVKYNEKISIIFTGDVHYNSHNFARDRWERDNQDIREIMQNNRVFFIQTGDVFEAMSTSERKFLAGGEFHKSTTTRIEKEYAKEIKHYAKEASYLKNNTLAVFGGNHYYQFYDGTTSDMALASEIKAPFIGCAGYIVLILRIDKYHSHVVRIFCAHGKSSGKRISSSMIAPEDMLSYFRDADIVVMGHDHKAGAMQVPALECRQGRGGHYKIQEVQRIIGRSGSYLRSYVPQVPSYAVDALMRPSTLGFLRVELTARRKNYVEKGIDDRWVDMRAII